MESRRHFELPFRLEAESEKPLYEQMYEQARELILSGVIEQGDRMPSIRELSTSLRVSHTTVERFYLQLVTEGYIESVPRSGYLVRPIDISYFTQEPDDSNETVRRVIANQSKNNLREENAAGIRAQYDFSFASLRPASFPTADWLKLETDVLYSRGSDGLVSYPASTDPPDPLCAQLAAYLSSTRGVSCSAEQIILANGTQHAMTYLLTLFSPRTHTVGMEEPGYRGAQDVIRRLGYQMIPLPTDEGARTFVDAVREASPKVIFTTPSHQFPTGKMLNLETRVDLLQWAHANNAYIVEDDACHEYRYGTRPIPSLYSLDRHGRVIYLGTFSKSLAPGLRISYLVLPPGLLERFHQVFPHIHPTLPWITSQVLARFMERGFWVRHVRKQVNAYRTSHDILLESLQRHMGNRLSISGIDSGLHFYVEVNTRMSQAELLDSARRNGANVYSTQRYWFSKKPPENAVIIGFSRIEPGIIDDGVDTLRRAWFPRG